MRLFGVFFRHCARFGGSTVALLHCMYEPVKISIESPCFEVVHGQVIGNDFGGSESAA